MMSMMDECKCPECKAKLVEFPASPLDNVVCPKCGSHDLSGWMKRSSLELVVVDWACDRCGHVWSGCYVLPKKLLAKF